MNHTFKGDWYHCRGRIHWEREFVLHVRPVRRLEADIDETSSMNNVGHVQKHFFEMEIGRSIRPVLVPLWEVGDAPSI